MSSSKYAFLDELDNFRDRSVYSNYQESSSDIQAMSSSKYAFLDEPGNLRGRSVYEPFGNTDYERVPCVGRVYPKDDKPKAIRFVAIQPPGGQCSKCGEMLNRGYVLVVYESRASNIYMLTTTFSA